RPPTFQSPQPPHPVDLRSVGGGRTPLAAPAQRKPWLRTPQAAGESGNRSGDRAERTENVREAREARGRRSQPRRRGNRGCGRRRRQARAATAATTEPSVLKTYVRRGRREDAARSRGAEETVAADAAGGRRGRQRSERERRRTEA